MTIVTQTNDENKIDLEKLATLMQATQGARVVKLFYATSSRPRAAQVINGKTQPATELTKKEFCNLLSRLTMDGWRISILLSFPGGYACRPPITCPICALRKAITLAGYCEVCQNAMDEPDAAELVEVVG